MHSGVQTHWLSLTIHKPVVRFQMIHLRQEQLFPCLPHLLELDTHLKVGLLQHLEEQHLSAGTHQQIPMISLYTRSGLQIPTASPGMIKAQQLHLAVVRLATQQQLLLQRFQLRHR